MQILTSWHESLAEHRKRMFDVLCDVRGTIRTESEKGEFLFRYYIFHSQQRFNEKIKQG